MAGKLCIGGLAHHFALEVGNGLLVEDSLGRVAEGRPLLGNVGVQVALQASRIVLVGVRSRGEVGGAEIGPDDRAEVNLHVPERTPGYATTAGARREDSRLGLAGECEMETLVLEEVAIATERGVGPVKDR